MSEDQWASLPDDTFLSLLGPLRYRKRDGLWEMALLTDERHRNLSGIVHGGVIATLMDRALGRTSRDTGNEQRFVTASLSVNYLRPVLIGQLIEIRCRLNKAGRGAVFASADAMVGDILVATGSAICMAAHGPGAGRRPAA
jgi:uncharacterized protein (TIGR00369 family)